jgi:hypothetical protein
VSNLIVQIEEERRLKVFENRVLRKILRFKLDEGTKEWKNYILRNLMICTPQTILFGEHIKKEMGACSTYGGDERIILGFGAETYGKGTTWKKKE